MSAAPATQSSRPVIIASSRQRRLWPLSTPERPFCLRSNQKGDAPLAQIIDALAAIDQFAAPTIILSESAAKDGLPLIARHNAQARILLVPSGIGSGTAVVLAAMMEANEPNPLPLALIPASFHADNYIHAFEGLAAMTIASKTEQLAIVMASRSPSVDLSFSLEMGERIPGKTLFAVNSFHIDRNPDALSAMHEMRTIARGCGPLAVPATLLLNRLTTNFPTLISACRNALQLADNAGQITRPHGDFLRLVGRPGVVQLIAPNLNDVALYLASDDCRIVQSFRDPSIGQSHTNAALPVEVCGYKDAKIIASHDGILLLRSGSEDAVKDLYQHEPVNSSISKSPQKTVRSFNWGSEEVLADLDDAHISKRTIQPKQRLLFDINAPLTRSIAILSGTLKVVIGGADHLLTTGDQFIIPQGSAHVLVNDSNSPALFVEIRTSAPLIINRLSA
jgi:mannose-1-phosphate guanylyltransferase/mannose-6-phosphate isomerase-like protein (cupin superfamily)